MKNNTVPAVIDDDQLLQSYEIDVRSLTHSEKKTLATQNIFLEAFARLGTIQSGLDAAGCSRRIAEKWRQHNHIGFQGRFNEAH